MSTQPIRFDPEGEKLSPMSREKEPDGIRRLRTTFCHIGTPGAKKKGVAMQLHPTDVVIAAPRKNGNTWTKQIAHGLRSFGDMDFEEISMVIPELEFATDYGYGEISRRQNHQPQLYHTHMTYQEIPKGGKYIFIIRDPYDSSVSLYHYWENWLFDPNDVSLDDFVKYFWLSQENDTRNLIPCQMQYTLDWYPFRQSPHVLWLHYEDLKTDLHQCVKLMANFMEFDPQDEARIDVAMRQADITFMKKHKTKFDSHLIKGAYNLAMGLDKDAGGSNAKVRNGVMGLGKQSLSKSVIELIDKRWKETIGKKLGFQNYAEMRASINKELARRFSELLPSEL